MVKSFMKSLARNIHTMQQVSFLGSVEVYQESYVSGSLVDDVIVCWNAQEERAKGEFALTYFNWGGTELSL